MRTLTLSAKTVRELRQTLLKPDEQERFAFLYAGDEYDLLGSQVVPIEDEKMARQSQTACRPAPAVERTYIGDCYNKQLAPVLVHSHPFSDDPRFSSIDIESMGRFREWISGLFPDESFGFAVVGAEGIEAVGEDRDRLAALQVEVIGDWKLDTPLPDNADRFTPSHSNHEQSTDTSARERNERTVRALGTDSQRRLQDATIGIVGVGGLGSIVSEQLARLGVEEIVLVDPDIVEESNLARLSGVYEHHVGASKVAAIREHLWKVGTEDLTIEIVKNRVEDQTDPLGDCDAIVGCVDEVTARSFCNEYAVKQLTYYIDAGVRIDSDSTENEQSGRLESTQATADDRTVEMTGYVHLVAPGSTACFDCLGRHNQEATRIEQMDEEAIEAGKRRGYVDDSDLAPEPALVHLNGMCASKTVSILVDLVSGGAAPPDFIRYEDHDHQMTELTTEPSDTCPTCGDDGVLGVGQRRFGDAQFEPDEEIAASD